MYKNFINKVKEYKNICIYRHARPDGDAVFSQFAMYEFLKANFKNKNIQIMGFNEYNLMPYSNPNRDIEFVKDSLAIVLDTATKARVDDDSFLQAKYIIKIDHHPITDNYGDINIVNDSSAATCELLTEMFLSKEFKNYKFTNDLYKYLYCGILTDSNSFRTSSTTPKTLLMASKLADIGKLDIAALGNYVFNISLGYFNKITKLRSLLTIKDGVGYIVADNKTLNELEMTTDSIKNAIDNFNSIKGLKIWGIFAYNAETNLYDASIRSIKNYVINDWCSKFNGGGHKNACGIKNLTLKDIDKVLKGLIKIAKK